MFGRRKFNEKKKILIYTPYYNPEPFPINTFVEELANRESIDKITVITSLPNYRNYNFYKGYSFFGPYTQKQDKVDIIRLPVIPRFSNSKLGILSFYASFFAASFLFLSIFSIFKRNKYDHILTFCGSPVYVGYIGFLFSKILNVQSSQWVQDIWPEAIESTVGIQNNKLRNTILKLQNYMWNLCDILFSESEALTEYLQKKFRNKKVITLYNPIREEILQSNNIIEKNHDLTIFSYIGNIGSAQNIELIIKSFLEANLPNMILNMCGDGSLLNELRNKYTHDKILWHGWIKGAELEEIFKVSDYYIVSLNSIGRQGLIIPSKVQTYFMNKKPLLCISSGAASKLIENIKAGLVCKSYNQKDIAKVFCSAVDINHEQRNKMATNGYNYYINNFTKIKIVDKFLSSI